MIDKNEQIEISFPIFRVQPTGCGKGSIMPTKVAVTREVVEWLEAALNYGAVVVSPTRADLAPGLRDLAAAVHEVLAGGVVDVKVTTPGDPTKKAELQKKFDAMFTAASGGGTPPVFTP